MDIFDLPRIDHAAEDRKRRDELLPAEAQALESDRALYLECMHGKPLKDRETYQEIRDGLILYGMIYRRLKEDQAQYGEPS